MLYRLLEKLLNSLFTKPFKQGLSIGCIYGAIEVVVVEKLGYNKTFALESMIKGVDTDTLIDIKANVINIYPKGTALIAITCINKVINSREIKTNP